MSQILVRDLEKEVVERLKKRAREEGRSLQSEVKLIIEQAVNKPMIDMEAARKTAEEFRRRFKGRKFPDTSGLIREDRER